MVADKPETAGGAAVERLPMPSHHNPLPLSASQETQVREVFYARVRSKCADDIKGTQPLPPPPKDRKALKAPHHPQNPYTLLPGLLPFR